MSEVVIYGEVWHADEYALDADGKLWQLSRYESRLTPPAPDHWAWLEFGSDQDDPLEPWLAGEWIHFGKLVPYTGGPKKPIRKAEVRTSHEFPSTTG